MQNDNDNDDDHVYSTRQVADEVGVSERDVREWARENGIGRVGVAFAFTGQDVDALADDVQQSEADAAYDEPEQHLHVEGDFSVENDGDYADDDED